MSDTVLITTIYRFLVLEMLHIEYSYGFQYYQIRFNTKNFAFRIGTTSASNMSDTLLELLNLIF